MALASTLQLPLYDGVGWHLPPLSSCFRAKEPDFAKRTKFSGAESMLCYASSCPSVEPPSLPTPSRGKRWSNPARITRNSAATRNIGAARRSSQARRRVSRCASEGEAPSCPGLLGIASSQEGSFISHPVESASKHCLANATAVARSAEVGDTIVEGHEDRDRLTEKTGATNQSRSFQARPRASREQRLAIAPFGARQGCLVETPPPDGDQRV